eukprot:GHVP01063261.1.p1 GENE.GHVP01063261.1~~GHVP01063261.1.p1  ORF type:complete len:115 (-),score=9.40 GHVP01063261.1:27-371(-)
MHHNHHCIKLAKKSIKIIKKCIIKCIKITIKYIKFTDFLLFDSSRYSEDLAIFQEVQTNSGEFCTIVDPMRDPAVSFCINYMQSFSTSDDNGLTMKYRVLKDSEVGVLASSLKW